MKRSQIIALAQKLTEKKLVGPFSPQDFHALFHQVEAEFCSEHRFWWKKKRFSFTTVAGQATYDLSDTVGLVTTPAGLGPFVDEITRVLRIDSATSVCELDPIFDDAGVLEMANDATQDKPSLYTVEENDAQKYQVLRLSPVPNDVYTIHVFFWAAPNMDQADADDVIYIIPSKLHHVLTTGLEKEIWRSVYGETNPKYTTAVALYNKKVTAAKAQTAYSPAKEVDFRNSDDEAIRSTL